jgi:RNA polymerase sigma-70 factor (ECF subfamily)
MYDKKLHTDDFINDVLGKHSDMVLRIARSHTKNETDAEDIFQDVFIRLMRSNKKFVSEEHLKAWLIRVTVNCSKSLLTSAWFRRTIGLEDEVAVNPPQINEIYDSVLRLPFKYRTAIHLHYYEDMTVAKIAIVLGTKENTIKSQLHRGRELLKNELEGKI